MGKAARWLRGLLGLRKEKGSEENHKDEISSSNSDSTNVDKRDKKRWSSTGKPAKSSEISSDFPGKFRSGGDVLWLKSSCSVETEKEQSKHAIAVGAATAAAADAAVAAAQAAEVVVRLTSNGRGILFCGGRERWAAMTIQTIFRGYLARKARRALRALVKIQALVRGYLVRKRTASTLYSIQALIRAQATVRSQRIRRSFNHENQIRPDIWIPRRSTERYEDYPRSEIHSKRLSASIDMNNLSSYYDETNPKIVEIDTYKPRSKPRRTKNLNAAFSECGDNVVYQGVSSPLLLPSTDFDWCFAGKQCKFPTAQSTPRFAGAPPLTPARTVWGEGEYVGHPGAYSNFNPNYMAKTQSFTAKVRSQSAPKQRPEQTPNKRLLLGHLLAARNSVSGVRMQRSTCSPFPEEHSQF